jgi:hypothetical protein
MICRIDPVNPDNLVNPVKTVSRQTVVENKSANLDRPPTIGCRLDQ